MIPTPIRRVLSTIQKHRVQALLMGGQACVFYGAAQFSKDVELVRFPDEADDIRPTRPLLAHAISRDLPGLRAALDAEARTEQEKDRAYWAPLKREIEVFRHAERKP